MLIESLSTRWHVQDHDGGKRVHVALRPYPNGAGTAVFPPRDGNP